MAGKKIFKAANKGLVLRVAKGRTNVLVRKAPVNGAVLFSASHPTVIGTATGNDFQDKLYWHEVITSKGTGWVAASLIEVAKPETAPASSGSKQELLNKVLDNDYKTYHYLIAAEALIAQGKRQGKNMAAAEVKFFSLQASYNARQRKIKEFQQKGAFKESAPATISDKFKSVWNSIASGLNGVGALPLLIPIAFAVAGGAASVGALWLWIERDKPQEQAFLDSKQGAQLVSDLNSVLTPEQIEKVKPLLKQHVDSYTSEARTDAFAEGQDSENNSFMGNLKTIALIGGLVYLGSQWMNKGR